MPAGKNKLMKEKRSMEMLKWELVLFKIDYLEA